MQVGVEVSSPCAPDVKALRHDERGAVMVTGLCMACFLIGGLWFIVGIGDAVVFRHRMQEATDHAAITSAMIHARGMNFISVCNIVLLVLVAVHLILGIIHDVMLALCLSTLIACPAWVTARNVWSTYHGYMKPAARAIHGVELAAAYTYPYAGMARGYQVGRKYGDDKHGVNVLTIGSSQIPHALIDVSGSSILSGGAPAGQKLGLPLAARPMSFLCEKLAKDIVGWVSNALGKLAGRWASWAGKLIGKYVGPMIKARYCNDLGTGQENDDSKRQSDDQAKGNRRIRLFNKLKKGKLSAVSGIDPGFDKFWGENGPLTVWRPASNGSSWMQVWGVNVGPKMDDVSERKVAVAQRAFDMVEPSIAMKTPVYFSQAEFFFDCTEGWGDAECNASDNAMFAVKWRARLRRAEGPELATMLGGTAVDAIFRSKMFKQAIENIKKTRPGKLGIDFGSDKTFEAEYRKLVDFLGGKADGATRAASPKVYH